MKRKFESGDRVKTNPDAWVDCVGTVIGTVIGYDEDGTILVKFDNLTFGHSGISFYLKKGIEYDPISCRHLYMHEDDLCLLEGN